MLYVETSVQRVEDRLNRISQSIDEEAVPNEAVRDRLESQQEDARTNLEAARGEPRRQERIDRFRIARKNSADAAEIWASLEDEDAPLNDVRSATDLREDVFTFDDEHRYLVGEDPVAAVCTHGTVRRLRDIAIEELNSFRTVDEPVQSLAAGTIAGHREAALAALEAAREIYSSFIDGVDDSETTAIHDAASSLERTYRDRTQSVASPIDEEPTQYVESDIDPDSATADVFEIVVSTAFRRTDFVGSVVENAPARAIRNAYVSLLALEGLKWVQSRIEPGELSGITDAADVTDYRGDAIEAIESMLGTDPDPLERWTALDLIDQFEQPDRILKNVAGENVERRSVHGPIARYCWIAGTADSTSNVIETVRDAFR
ncbi:hypothetical protein [Natronorubrum sp. DTA7]|uniref:hypothetical protein n=1 Tax=Natronorubrum sp. DTA7 TaxID=3447016 RepID=UPI003F84D0D4